MMGHRYAMFFPDHLYSREDMRVNIPALLGLMERHLA